MARLLQAQLTTNRSSSRDCCKSGQNQHSRASTRPGGPHHRQASHSRLRRSRRMEGPASSRVVSLNVGGQRFAASVQTLTRVRPLPADRQHTGRITLVAVASISRNSGQRISC